MAANLNKRVLRMAQFAVLLGIEAIVCFTPLGSLPAVGPIVATLAHVPVIITAIVLGTGAGTAMGFATGVFSLIVWSVMPPPQSAAFAFAFSPFYSVGEFHGSAWSAVVSILPRTLIGLVAGAAYRAFSRKLPGNFLPCALSGVLGSLTNTFGVLGLVYLFFGHAYASTMGIEDGLLLGVLGLSVLTSGLPEAVIGGVLGYSVGRPLLRMQARMQN